MHVMHTAKAVDAFGTKDYAGSYANAAMGYVHMGATGDILAGAIATQKSLGETTGDAADLRVKLDDLLGRARRAGDRRHGARASTARPTSRRPPPSSTRTPSRSAT